MAVQSFIGTWEIESCWLPGYYGVESGVEGTRFTLDDTGDVVWQPANGDITSLLLYSFETYEVYTSTSGPVLRFGSYGDHTLTFKAQFPESSEKVELVSDNWCILSCSKTHPEDFFNPVENYTLLPAVEDGFFSDMVIEAKDHKQFHVHSTILSLLGGEESLESLSGLPEPVVGSVLHWLYAECLPSAMTEELARQVITAVNKFPSMSRLVLNCKVYLKNIALKQQIVELVTDIHGCANQIIEYFTAPGECLGCNPVKLCLVVKQSIRETAVAIMKLLLLCDLFTKCKSELSREERHEVIKYARSRLPVFMCQLHRLLEALMNNFNGMTYAQRQEVAAYLVPEIEAILEMITGILVELKIAFEKILQSAEYELRKESSPPDVSHCTKNDEIYGKSLRKEIRKEDVVKLKDFYQKITLSLMLLLHRKEGFAEMTDNNRIRSVSRNLEQLIEELPVFLFRLDEVTSAIDDRLQWKEFKYHFKLTTSKVYGIICKLLAHKDRLQDVIVRCCSLTQREAFTSGVIMLGLLNNSSVIGGAPHSDHDKNHSQSFKSHLNQHGFKLSLVESLMNPPSVNQSNLSKAAGDLLNSEKLTDMVFEITSPHTTQFDSNNVPTLPSENSINNLSKAALPKNNGTQASSSECASSIKSLPGESVKEEYDENGSVILKAHRVIVAARCDWFRRALQSGMKEAIHRRIVIHDTSPALFRKLLKYLYTGKLDATTTNAEQLTDLLLLGDRYELDALKEACEKTLATKHLDKETAFYFLSLADQYNALHLKDASLKFIATHLNVKESDMFTELPERLKLEVTACVPPHVPLLPSHKRGVRHRQRHNIDHISLEALLDRTSLDEGSNSDCSSVEEISIDITRLNDCLAHLRDVLGSPVSQEDLHRIALAADYDANRAINFFYSRTHNTHEGS